MKEVDNYFIVVQTAFCSPGISPGVELDKGMPSASQILRHKTLLSLFIAGYGRVSAKEQIWR